MKTRIFRVLVCFALVCALLVGVCVPAHSSVLVATTATVLVKDVVIPTLIALGIALAVNEADERGVFDDVATRASVAMREAGYAVNGFIDVVVDAGHSFVQSDFIMALRDWLYDSETLSVPYGAHKAAAGFTFSNGERVYPASPYLSFVVSYQNNYGQNCLYEFILLTSRCDVFLDDWTSTIALSSVVVDNVRYYYYAKNSQNVSDISSAEISLGKLSSSSGIVSGVITAYLSGAYAPTAAEGLTLADRVATPEITEEEILEVVWIDPRIWELIPDGDGDGGDGGDEPEKQQFWPVSVPGNSDWLTSTMTQDQAQSGVTDLQPDSNGDSGTDTDSGSDSGSNTTPPSSSDYSMDLTAFFPFCLPFDIYEFFSLLAADPVAPVFEWVIPVPQADAQFPIRIDLSAWDTVAALFRTFELLAFIVGLAIMTRDKFLRG